MLDALVAAAAAASTAAGKDAHTVDVQPLLSRHWTSPKGGGGEVAIERLWRVLRYAGFCYPVSAPGS